MIKKFQGILPEIHSKAYIAEGGQVIGKVKMKEFSSIWYNAVVRGDVNRIEIGRYTNVQDNSVVHVADEYPTIIGDYVTIGHGAILHGCKVEEHCLIGMGAVVLNGVEIGKGSIIAAGAVIKEGTKIPPYSLAVGVPARIVKTLPEKIDSIHAQALKYKTLWTEDYGILPNADGEKYSGGEII
ncbi:gamma carbonic anhydrase family protein [Garciella nitratireducens]|uniref:Carbonic anhydrase or acetyltransferase, isoleucine patch superfamily n=1 Tax=Garciella nitratireducens DSM 15102 TaxID=1121911 RepID=A0A1T4L6K1_9FIRM|nr:gamma carbonic anhydrase family protein [Garciella nitratireducens]SJZ50228.1 Carbonic anhydrase or acetyltransferase, isoleucine patch superfamily [Garciella nitratireducens DSM 15102]